jgi:hypothetical protein
MLDRFNGLRCRPGDLAVITQDEPECQANIGQIVRVISEYPLFPDELGFHWLVEPQSNQTSPVVVSHFRGKSLNREVIYDNGPRAHYDGWLRPLLDTQSPDEMTLLAESTTETECCDALESAVT